MLSKSEMTTVERLERAKATISNPADWGQGINRSCACALDALRVIENETDGDIEVRIAAKALCNALPEDFEEDESDWNHPVAQFNDEPSTTHTDIMALFDRAIAAAREA